MDSRSRSTVVAALALALACAALARVPQANQIDVSAISHKTANDLPTQHAVAFDPIPQNTPQPAKKEEDKNKPVHERYPHAVLFGRTCGGTIISPSWILTAGHCTLFTSGLIVLGGTGNSADGSGVAVRVKRLELHPLFSVGPHWLSPSRFHIKQVAARWDFMLAELEQPFELDNRTIAAAVLDDGPPTNGGLPVAFAGYGAENHGETMRHNMHAMELVTLEDAECRKLPQYDAGDMMCARGRPPRLDTACNGDSGSGLVDDNGRLLGVASWVENDATECRNGNIVVFSRVSAVRDWIRQVTGI